MSEYIIDWDNNLVIDTFSKNSLREEIVRCSDCKHATEYGNSCTWWGDGLDTEPDGFCAWGERK